ADAAARTVVPWRQPHASAPLLAVPRAATQGTDGRDPDAGVLRRARASQAREEMPLAPALIDAYETADYVVFTDPELVLRIGEPSPRLDALLEAEGASV